MKKYLSLLFIFLLIFQVPVYGNTDFSDVKKDRWSYEYIMELRNLGITNGVGDNKFAPAESITRAQFVTFLCNLMNWNTANHSRGSFSDNQDTSSWYFKYIETALVNGAIVANTDNFRPNEGITREEMAIMLVRSLDLDATGQRLSYLTSSFKDVSKNTGYITIAKDLGIISGIGDNKFNPEGTATREQAATMMVRMNNIRNTKIKYINGFYAIKSSEQIDFINSLDSTSFGWCRLENNNGLSLNTSSSNNNEYNIPNGYETPFNMAKNKMLMIAVSEQDSVNIINDSNLRTEAADLISKSINSSFDGKLSFDGVVLDFEGLKSDSKNNYSLFLLDLKNKLNNKKMFVAVQPKRRDGHAYYDGYDYKTIGEIADKVILMAHDYNPKVLTSAEMDAGIVQTPASPLDEVYYGLKSITDENTGVADKSKIIVQFSFSTIQWKVRDGRVINKTPLNPDYDSIIKRIDQGAERKFDDKTQSSYITFTENGETNYVWFENSKSIEKKLNLIKLFGIEQVSLWRLGIIPAGRSDLEMNVWETILASK